MSNTNMVLGSWRLDEWPEYVTVSHDGMREPGRRYVPERTCRIIEDGCGLAHCSECGFEFDPYDCSGIPEEGVPYEYDGRYCKNCGAKVAVE